MFGCCAPLSLCAVFLLLVAAAAAAAALNETQQGNISSAPPPEDMAKGGMRSPRAPSFEQKRTRWQAFTKAQACLLVSIRKNTEVNSRKFGNQIDGGD